MSKRPTNWYIPERPLYTKRTPVIVKPTTTLHPLPEERAKYEARVILEHHILPMLNQLDNTYEVRLQIICSRFFVLSPFPYRQTGLPEVFSYNIMSILFLTIAEIGKIAPDYGLNVHKNNAGHYWSIKKNQSVQNSFFISNPRVLFFYTLGHLPFYFIASLKTFAKYFILFKHSSIVFPVAPTSIITEPSRQMLIVSRISQNNWSKKSWIHFICNILYHYCKLKILPPIWMRKPPSICSNYKHKLGTFIFTNLYTWSICISTSEQHLYVNLLQFLHHDYHPKSLIMYLEIYYKNHYMMDNRDMSYHV